ncbi:MAG: recombinase family protein [Anaeromassilibacillus sp.]
MRFFIYSRKSVYTGKGESVENQIEMCKQYIRSKFPDVVEDAITIYEDEGFSAKDTIRPQFQRMLQDIRERKPDYIVCYRLDRISRSVSDFSALIEELNDRNISFICIKEEFDTSKPMGKAMMYIASVFAQLERETIAERVRDNMCMLARTGRWLGGTPPTGYRSEKQQEMLVDGKIKISCRLKESPDELQVVGTIFEKYLELHSLTGVSKYLIRQGIQSRNGTWYSLLGIKEILHNPVYCIADKEAFSYFTAQHANVCFEEKDCKGRYGLLAYNKRDYKKKHAPRQSMDQWIVAIGRHRGKIPGKKWVAVQGILQDSIPTGKKPANIHNESSLLSGRIICGKCGSRMFAKGAPTWGRSAVNSIIYAAISCAVASACAIVKHQRLTGRCYGIAYLVNLAEESPGIYKLLEALKRDLQKQTRRTLQLVLKQSSTVDDAISHLVHTLSQDGVGAAFIQHVNNRIEALEQERSSLLQEREQLQMKRNSITGLHLEIERLAGSLSDLKGLLRSLSVQEKRSLIHLLVQRIVWDGKNLHVFLDLASNGTESL